MGKKITRVGTLSPMAVNALIFGGIGLAVYFLFFSKDAKQQALVDTAGGAVADLTAAGNGPTITDTEAESLSSSLASAFSGCGTDESQIMNVFQQMTNTADVYKLINIYGVRSYQGCFEGSIFSESVTSNLSTALYSELSAGYISDINKILSLKGINFNF